MTDYTMIFCVLLILLSTQVILAHTISVVRPSKVMMCPRFFVDSSTLCIGYSPYSSYFHFQVSYFAALHMQKTKQYAKELSKKNILAMLFLEEVTVHVVKLMSGQISVKARDSIPN